MRSQNQQSPQNKKQQQQNQDVKGTKNQQQLNRNCLSVLPPGIEGSVYGHLFIEIGNLEWLIYDGQNYLESSGIGTSAVASSEVNKGVNSLFCNIKFWGDQKGIYLKFANGIKKKEQAINKFKFDIKAPEKIFEKYLDDMEALVVEIFDCDKNLTIGSSKLIIKLYLKRAKSVNDDSPLLELRGKFPITSRANENVKIGEFSISLISSFSDPFNPKGLQPREAINLEDSFIQNEKLADQLSRTDKNKGVIEKGFSDDRVPSSIISRNQNPYNKETFENDPNQRDYQRDRQQRQQQQQQQQQQDNQNSRKMGKENQRNLINIDESDDTFHNEQEFERIFSRGENLRKQMNEALEQDKAWETIHGQNVLPKRYVPPFLQQEEQKRLQIYDDDELDNIYAIEIEGSTNIDNNEQQNQNETQIRQQEQSNSSHIRDMKFIKMKILTLKIDNEELLHSLIDTAFNLIVELPLPDIYQKKITYQQVKLNNYDIVSFNEFLYNSMSLYNFKFDEDTFNQLVSSQIRISLEGKQTTGTLNMNRVLLANGYKLSVSIPLERKVIIEEQKKKPSTVNVTKKQDIGKNKKNQVSQVAVKEPVKPQEFSKIVGNITLEINLQRGDTEEELARDYQLKIKNLIEQKTLEDLQRQKEVDKRNKFSQSQDPVFAQLYICIDKIRNICLGQDGSTTINANTNANINETFNQRQIGEALNTIIQSNQANQENENGQIPFSQKRNLYVQYKSFPTLDKLKTNVIYHEKDPKFGYRSQFPLIMSPELLEKFEKFTFILEVWDQVSPAKEDFIGLVKIPLSSFCYSMRTNDDEIFSLNFLADQHCYYPMIVADDYLPIYSPKHGANVGELKITLALGTPLQINRQIQKEQEQEKTIMQVTFQQQLENTLKLKIEQEKSQQELKSKVEDDLRRKFLLEQEEQKKNEVEPERSATPERLQDTFQGGNFLQKNMQNFLRQSLNLQGSRGDLDLRKMNFINCMRKLFEEARSADIQELNSDDIFRDVVKSFDGSVKKDDFIYSILNRQEFTLTRTELSNICQIMLNINRDDNNNIDVDELQMSYKAYLKYYEIIEQRMVDLLEKFKVNILKKLENSDQIEELINQIEQNSSESKIQLNDYKQLLESNGILIRDALYDQLSAYFDLDRNGSIYIQSFCEYMRNPSMSNFNFFKVNPVILNNQISEFIKNAIETNKDSLINFENEFKLEIFKIQTKNENPNVNEIPEDFLLNERINAKLFQFKLKRQGIVLSLWEVFSIFEHLNTHYAKMYYEPQRYHYINFGLFYKFITNEDYDQKISKQAQEALDKLQVKASMDSVFGLAQAINQKKKKKGDGSSEEGLYSDSNQEFEEEEEVIIQKDKKKRTKGQEDITFEKKKQKGKNVKQTDFEEQESGRLTDKSIQMEEQLNSDEIQRKLNRPYQKIKHIFEIKVKELKNIPILDKLIKDQNLNNQALTKSPTISQKQKSPRSQQNNYIQSVSVKYSFPLDEDEILESDYLQLNSENLSENNQFDYKVSMNTTHTYILNKEDKIEKLFQQQNNHESDQSFNVSLILYDDRREFVIGNASLPIEDIVDSIQIYDINNQQNANQVEIVQNEQNKTQILNRILFIYGTTFSQRENCIIGKLNLEISYSTEKQYINQDDQQNEKRDKFQGNQSCFMHRETYVNRKIPLNAILSVYIDRISNLKESIDNIEHFAKIQTGSYKDLQENTLPKNSRQTVITGASGKSTIKSLNKDQTDRRRILTSIFRDGLNLTIIGSLFEEDNELKKKFPGGKHQTRMLFNTLNPVFNEQFEQNVQMDTNIFEYLKNKRAIFEIRHYIAQNQNQSMHPLLQKTAQSQSQERLDTQRSGITEEENETMEKNDFIVIGFVRVPLIQLITKNNGIEGDFLILDDYKQQMGSLKLRIALNHHNGQRPLYSGTNKLPPQNIQETQNYQNTTLIDKTMNISTTLARGKPINFNEHQYILGLNFVELITKNRLSLFNSEQISQNLSQPSLLYLKFKFLGSNYQTKFFSNNESLSQQPSEFMKKLQMKTFDIRRTIFIDIDLSKQNEVEEAFSKPLEIQLWLKKENAIKYKQPEQEIQLGSFFVELNELSKYKNRRIKDSNGSFYSYESYFSLYDYEKEQVSQDRLAIKLYLIRKEYESQIQDLEVLFHNMKQIDQDITQNCDSVAKGYIELDELKQIIDNNLKGPYQQQMKKLLEYMEYKNTDQVYYSSLFGLPQPYFRERYTKRFDQFGIIEKINKELQALDNHDNGFVPVGLFKSVLDHELKMKAKIVEDFILNMRDGELHNFKTLDVNVVSHSFKNHIDYVTLLRKLILYFEIKQNENRSINENAMLSGQRDIINEELDNSMNLKVQIECAIRLKNPFNELEAPNSFVHLKLPFRNCNPQQIETNVIQRNSYPTWQYQSSNIQVPLTSDNVRTLMTQGLEFEVYHAKLNKNDKIGASLIGVAFVDLSLFAFVDNQFQISGHFHILKKGDYQTMDKLTSVNPTRLSSESLGQIKISITTSTNVQKILAKVPLNQTLKNQYSPIKQQEDQSTIRNNEFNPFQQMLNNQSFARETYQDDQYLRQSSQEQQEQLFCLMNATQQKLETSFKQFGLTLNKESDIKNKHNQNMLDLDELNQKLLSTLNGSKSAEQQKEDEKIPYNKDFGETRGHDQSKIFSSQIKGIEIENEGVLKRYATAIFDTKAVVEEEGSELDREDNIFDNNHSEASDIKNEQEEQQQNVEIINNQQSFNKFQSFIEKNSQQQLQEYQQQQQQQQQPFIQTFNRKNTQMFKLDNQYQQQQNKDDDLNSNEDEKYQTEQSNKNSFLEDSFRQSQSNNIFEMQNLNRFQEEKKQENKEKEESTITKKMRGNFKIIDDEDDDDFDEVEMARIEKILKSQKK